MAARGGARVRRQKPSKTASKHFSSPYTRDELHQMIYECVMRARYAIGLAFGILIVAIGIGGCKSGSVGASASDTASSGAVVAGLDKCVVGAWRSTQAVLSSNVVLASGGANVSMTIGPSGAATLDFSNMQEIVSTTNTAAFSFHYSGKAKTLVKTPGPDALSASQSDYSTLRVTALVRMPGGAAAPLFRDMPVANLIPKTGPMGTPVPVPSQSAGIQGVDPTPVLSADTYTCSPTTLTLSSRKAHMQWIFTRSQP
jgi:hypothetical protein